MSEQNKQVCSILVSSLDMYEDVWKAFFTLFFRYWPDCPYQVYLMTNTKEYQDARVTSIKVGGDKIWSINIKRALPYITTPYLIFFLEDFFLERKVDTDYIKKLVAFAESEKAACIHLSPFEPPKAEYPNDLGLGLINKDAEYRTSLRTAIWNKDIFESLIKEGESAWDMEREGTVRSKELDAPFLSVKEPAIKIHSLASVRGGKWLYDSIKILGKEGIHIDLSKRAVDYEGKWRSVFDHLRKNSFAQGIRRIPVLGKALSWLYWRLSFLKVNKIFNRKNSRV